MDLNSYNKIPCSIHFNGYCEEFESFIKQAYRSALSCGCIIQNSLQNPSSDNVAYLQNKLGVDFEVSEKFFLSKVTIFFPQLGRSQKELLASSLTKVMEELLGVGKNESSLRNYYIKWMSWLYSKFTSVLSQIGTSKVPVIIWCMSYNISELRLVQVLNLCGCSIVVVDKSCSEEAYKKADSDYKCSILYKFSDVKPFPQSWDLRSVVNEILSENKLDKFLSNKDTCIKFQVKTDINQLCMSSLLSDKGSDTYVLQVNGVDSSWNNALFNLRGSIKSYSVITKSITSATPLELQSYSTKWGSDTDCLYYLFSTLNLGNDILNNTFRLAFYDAVDVFKIKGVSKLINLWVMCLRYKSFFSNDSWLFVLVSTLSESNKFVLDVLRHMNINLILLNPSKKLSSVYKFTQLGLNEEEEIMRFPSGLNMQRIDTVANKAEQEIQGVLYNGSLGIYKDKQFTKAQTAYLNLTFEEIKLLWNEDLSNRQGFSETNGVVTMPVIHAKINGIPNGDFASYKELFNYLVSTGNTLVVDTFDINLDFLDTNSTQPFTEKESQLYDAYLDRRSYVILPDRLTYDIVLSNKDWKYKHLSRQIQMYLVDKIQEFIDARVVSDNTVSRDYLLGMLFNLPNEVLSLIQTFDFTKKNPKLVCFKSSSDCWSNYTSIVVAFLSFIGFDVIYFTPNGYNLYDSEVVVDFSKVFEFGNYRFDITQKSLNSRGSSKKSFFSRVLGL